MRLFSHKLMIILLNVNGTGKDGTGVFCKIITIQTIIITPFLHFVCNILSQNRNRKVT